MLALFCNPPKAFWDVYGSLKSVGNFGGMPIGFGLPSFISV